MSDKLTISGLHLPILARLVCELSAHHHHISGPAFCAQLLAIQIMNDDFFLNVALEEGPSTRREPATKVGRWTDRCVLECVSMTTVQYLLPLD